MRPGGAGHVGEAGLGQQGAGGWVAVAVFAHLADQGGGHEWSDAGEAAEDAGVGVRVEEFVDLLVVGAQVGVEQSQLVDEEPGAERFAGDRAGSGGEQVGT